MRGGTGQARGGGAHTRLPMEKNKEPAPGRRGSPETGSIREVRQTQKPLSRRWEGGKGSQHQKCLAGFTLPQLSQWVWLLPLIAPQEHFQVSIPEVCPGDV